MSIFIWRFSGRSLQLYKRILDSSITVYGAILIISILLTGCSLRKMAMNSVADSLASGGDVFMSENDPDLVRDALPFTLKMYESILRSSPDNVGLLTATSSAFTMYAYGFLMMEADMIDREDYRRAEYLRHRSLLLLLRARDYALQGLEVRHPGFEELIRKDYHTALKMVKKKDAALLYWGGVSWSGALSAAKDNMKLMSELPVGAAMVEKVMELDEIFNNGAAHEFFITYYGGRPAAMGGSIEKARWHYRRSLELSEGKTASPYLALATSVSIAEQDAGEFRALLQKALEIDVDRYPEQRLSNSIMHKKARWLLDNIEDFFLTGGQ